MSVVLYLSLEEKVLMEEQDVLVLLEPMGLNVLVIVKLMLIPSVVLGM